jgi:hypothetical protein
VKGLGSVSVDTQKKERDFKHLTLSDHNVVKYLIQFRSKVDVGYGANTNIDIRQAGDTFEFNQELIALYASLDEVIEECKFKEKQTQLLHLIFEGYTLQDICELDIGFRKSATYDMLHRIVKRVVKANDDKWKEAMKNLGHIKST